MAGFFRRTDLRLLIVLMFILLAFIHDATCARLEPGVEKFILATSHHSKDMPVFAVKAFEKSMFKKTAVNIFVSPEKVFCNTSFTVAWELRCTRCAQLYNAGVGELFIQSFMEDPSLMYSVETEISVIRNESDKYDCNAVKSGTVHPQFPPSIVTTCYVPPRQNSKPCKHGTLLDADPNVIADADPNVIADADPNVIARKRESNQIEGKKAIVFGRDQRSYEVTSQNAILVNTYGKVNKDPDYSDKHVVTYTPVTGSYLLMLNISTNDVKGSVSFYVTVDMKGPNGYLSATQYPLLKFYGVMCGVDALLLFVWLFLLCRQYQNLLGIHIWIGVVVFFVLVEKLLFFGEFKHMNNKGTESNTGILLAELMSCVKRTLDRLLLLIISFGYGFTKHTLGADTKYVVTFGLLYMALSTAEAIMRVSEEYEHSMIAVLPLSVLELILLVWIFRGLRKTTDLLRLGNRKAKLQSYRLFTITAVLTVVCSFCFSVWSMKTHRFSECVEKHYELWLDDAFWNILFHFILFVIMFVFRPQNPKPVYIQLLNVNVIVSDDKNEVNVPKCSAWKAVKDIDGDS